MIQYFYPGTGYDGIILMKYVLVHSFLYTLTTRFAFYTEHTVLSACQVHHNWNSTVIDSNQLCKHSLGGCPADKGFDNLYQRWLAAVLCHPPPSGLGLD